MPVNSTLLLPPSNSTLHPLYTTSHPLDTFEGKWNYIGRSIALINLVLNGVLKSGHFACLSLKAADKNIRATIVHLKFFSIIGVPLSISSLENHARKFCKAVEMMDKEVAIAIACTVAVVATDILDSLNTFVTATIEFFAYPPILFLSSIGIPLAIVNLASGSTARLLRLKNIAIFENGLETQLLSKFRDKTLSNEELHQEAVKFLKCKFCIKDQEVINDQMRLELKKWQETVLERHSNPRIVKLIRKLEAFLDENPKPTDQNLKIIVETLDSVIRELDKERMVQKGLLTANLVIAIAITTFYLPVVSWMPFALLTLGFSIRLVMQAYNDFGRGHNKIIPFHPWLVPNLA